MKYLAYYLVLLLSLVKAQAQEKIEILLVGTQHEFNNSLKSLQNFESIQNRLASFKPDIICIESIPVSDAASLKEVRVNQLKVAAQLRAEKGIPSFGLKDSIRLLIEKLEKKPNDLIIQSELANHYYANNDFWNGYYHYYRLYDGLKDCENPDTVALRQSFALDSLHVRVTERNHNGEYHNIVYPLAKKLNILELQNIDYRADEEEFLKRMKKAAIGTIFNLKIFKLQKLMKTMNREMHAAEQKGQLMDYINSQAQQDFFIDLIDNSYRFKKGKNIRKAVELWEFRNEIMAQRILEAAQEKNAQRVLVTFGAFHVPFVKRYLEKNPNVRVITYNEFN